MSPENKSQASDISEESSTEPDIQLFLGFFQQTEGIILENSGLDEDAFMHSIQDKEKPEDAGVSIDLPFKLDGTPYTARFGGYPWSSTVFNKSIEVCKRSDANPQPSFQINIFYEYDNDRKIIDEVDVMVGDEHVDVADFFDKGSKALPEFFSRIELDMAT